MRALRAAAAALVLALLGLLVWDVAHGGQGGVASKVDHGHAVAAPKLNLPYLGRSGDFDLAAYRGKVVVLNFWASWCVDCKLEAKELHDAAARWSKDGKVVFVGIDGTDLASAARGYMKHYAIDYPVARAVGDGTKNTWGVTGDPETVLIDRTGHVVQHVVGPIVPKNDYTPADLNSEISRLLS